MVGLHTSSHPRATGSEDSHRRRTLRGVHVATSPATTSREQLQTVSADRAALADTQYELAMAEIAASPAILPFAEASPHRVGFGSPAHSILPYRRPTGNYKSGRRKTCSRLR